MPDGRAVESISTKFKKEILNVPLACNRAYAHLFFLSFAAYVKTKFSYSWDFLASDSRIRWKSCDKMPGNFPCSQWIHLNGLVLPAAVSVFCCSFACGLVQNVFCHYRWKSAKQGSTKGCQRQKGKLNSHPYPHPQPGMHPGASAKMSTNWM